MHEPVPLRAFQPAYASFTTTASSEASSLTSEATAATKKPSDEPKRRLAVEAPTNSTVLLNLLHKMVGHATESCEMMCVDPGSLVKVIGWREVPSQTSSRSHLVYTILAAAPSSSQTSEARLVQRRYNDFVKLQSALLPHARQAGLTLPALPSKLSSLGRRLSPAVGAQRQKALHCWLCWVVSHPQLLCDALRLFLGLSPKVTKTALPKATEMAGPEAMELDMNASTDDEPSCGEKAFAVDLAHLEQQAVECMLDDKLWGRDQ